jgi:hypothetical protein
MSVSLILQALECTQVDCPCHATARSGFGNSHCPAHPDETPSLTIALTRDAAQVWVCWAGCKPKEIDQALRERGLNDGPSHE